MDPNNFKNHKKQQFQFLDLSKPSGASVAVINKYLKGKGILDNQGKAFLEAAKRHSINDLYLIAHARLETGNGTSELATCVEVGIDKNGNLKLVKYSKKGTLKNIKTTYNMFGIGAIDSDSLKGGAKTAYVNEWFSPQQAIE